MTTLPRRALSILLLISSGVGLHGQSFMDSNPEVQAQRQRAVAYKKEIGRDPSTWQWNIPLPLPHFTHGVVHSAVMDRDIGYNIFLPPGYAENTAMHYPVVYYCHGATGSESSDNPLVDLLVPAIEHGEIGPVIYVFPNAGHFSGFRDRPDDKVMVETYLMKEFIPEIDRRYRTIATREGRALMGFSMGGGGATRLALKYPDMFFAMASFAGALDGNPDAPAGPNAREPNPDNVYHWATENQEKIKGRLGLSFVVGGADRMYARNAPFMDYLHSLGISFNYRVLAGIDHDLWGSMALCGDDAIRFLAGYYAKAAVVTE